MEIDDKKPEDQSWIPDNKVDESTEEPKEIPVHSNVGSEILDESTKSAVKPEKLQRPEPWPEAPEESSDDNQS